MERRPASSDAYLEAWSRVVGAYLAGDPASALRLTADMVGRFPSRRAGLGHARACLLCATGRPGDALAEAREVVAAGSWWTDRKLADPDLAGLGAFEEWAALVRTMRERSRAALGAARRREAGMEVVVTAGRRPRAVVVALHMYGVTASETAGIWADPAAADLAVVVPEARLADGDGRPCWDDEQQSLTRAGIRCRLMMVPGLAHLYPPAWPQMALDAVEAVLGSG